MLSKKHLEERERQQVLTVRMAQDYLRRALQTVRPEDGYFEYNQPSSSSSYWTC